MKILVNGVGTVDVAKLAAMTSFNDESSLTTNDNVVKRFETWFWEVVNSFTQSERQELLYFWTGKFETTFSAVGYPDKIKVETYERLDSQLSTGVKNKFFR